MVGERLKGLVRSEDVVARVGGDEFAIVINNANSIETIAQVAQKILGGLLKASMLNGREVYVTASLGISVYPGDGEDIETLIKNADVACAKAKANGGNNYQFGTADVTEKAQEKSKQQSALNQAMAKNELLLYYQPCLTVSDQAITCVEALIRWQNKEYGLVMPDTIIPMAEESGLIVPISEWILRTACKQVKQWQKENPSLKLAINLSAYQFKNLNFMNNIIRALRETEFSPQALVLEVTEGLIMHDHENTMSILTKIKEEGISIVVDDFGTGFSSFSYLSNYAVDKIKIDQSFVQQITKGTNEVAIVSAMISMADKLGMKAVAKGVETKEQYDLLVSEGCNEMQGYYIAKPLPVEIMESFLKSRAVVPTENNEPRQG
jgi:EAL domain-containing protein (putative c-di-GMP-specific phosphodiesterase class I)